MRLDVIIWVRINPKMDVICGMYCLRRDVEEKEGYAVSSIFAARTSLRK